jgi:hypothetical protein
MERQKLIIGGLVFGADASVNCRPFFRVAHGGSYTEGPLLGQRTKGRKRVN